MSDWLPVTLGDVVVGDAILLSGTDPAEVPWILTGRVRGRAAGVRLLVEWTALYGAGRPIWSLWRTHILKPTNFGTADLYRHSDHGPEPRTDAAGLAMLRARISGVSAERIATFRRPGIVPSRVGFDAAVWYRDGTEAPPEFVLRQLDGSLSRDEAEAYDPTVRVWPGLQEHVHADIIRRWRPRD